MRMLRSISFTAAGGASMSSRDVVALAVLLDAVGEVAQAPVFALGDLAALLADERREGLGQGFDLGGEMSWRAMNTFS